MEKLQVIRGDRILNQLLTETSTYRQLEQNTLSFQPPSTRRQHSVDEPQVTELEMIPIPRSKKLTVKAIITNGPGRYLTTVQFDDVEYHPEDMNTNISFSGKNGEEFHVTPIQLGGNTVKVRCNCLDFRFRFADYNAGDQSLYGRGFPRYQPKTNRPPSNARRVPGVCKHLMKTVIALKDMKLVT